MWSPYFQLMDPRIGPIWHDHISEILPLFQGPERWATLVYALGHPFLGLWGVRWLRDIPTPLRSPLGVGMGVSMVMALCQTRHAMAAQIWGVVPMMMVLDRGLKLWPRYRVMVLLSGLLAPALGAFLLSPWGNSSPSKATQEGWDRVFQTLLTMEGEHAPRMQNDPQNNIFLTPLGVESTRLLFQTPWSVLSAPYHRDAKGVLATYHIFAAPTPKDARHGLKTHRIRYILFQKDHLRRWMESAPHVPDTAFYHHLLEDDLHENSFWVVLTLPPPLNQNYTLIYVPPH